MFPGLMTIAVGSAGVLAGEYVAEKWVLKDGPDDPDGFIQMEDGFGLDEIARGVTVFVVTWAVLRLVRGKKKAA